MHRQYATVIFLTSALVALAACSGGGLRTEVRGSGTLVSQARAVSGFSSILVSGHGNVQIDITGTESLWVEAEDNILEVLTIEVLNGRLELGHRAFTNIIPTRDITYRITAASLDGVVVAGSGDVEVAGVRVSDFSVSISGSGSVAPSGSTERLSVDVSGSGTYDGLSLQSRVAGAGVSGSGQAIVSATESLAAAVSGSGTVRYLGQPLVAGEVSGSGAILPY